MFARKAAVGALIGAAALTASAAAHAVEVALENAGVLGDAAARFAHAAQRSILGAALVLAGVALVICVDSVLRATARRQAAPDWVLPAFETIRKIGLLKLYGAVASVQLIAYAGGELAEQRAAGYHASLGLLFGGGHQTAPAVLLVVALMATLFLSLCAQWICKRARRIVAFAGVLLRIVAPLKPASISLAARARRTSGNRPRPSVLATRIANRPPPLSAPLQ